MSTTVEPTPKLGDFLRDDIYPRLMAESVYDAPDLRWHKANGKWRGDCPWHDSKSGTAINLSTSSLL